MFVCTFGSPTSHFLLVSQDWIFSQFSSVRITGWKASKDFRNPIREWVSSKSQLRKRISRRYSLVRQFGNLHFAGENLRSFSRIVCDFAAVSHLRIANKHPAYFLFLIKCSQRTKHTRYNAKVGNFFNISRVTSLCGKYRWHALAPKHLRKQCTSLRRLSIQYVYFCAMLFVFFIICSLL